MSQTRRQFAASALALALAPPVRAEAARTALVIACGASQGGWPAQTRLAYEKAIEQGADFLEGGLVCSKDGILVVRADDELSGTTDVATRADFAARRATRVIGGETREGWFTEDFTLAELKSLTLTGAARGRRVVRDAPPAILTLEELIAIARAGSVRQARVVGVYAFLRHPAYFASLDLALEHRLAQVIRAQGYDSPAAALLVASDDLSSLRTMAGLTRARRVLRMGGGANLGTGAPRPDLQSLAGQVFAVAPDADQVLDVSDPRLIKPSGLVQAAHTAGLEVHAWAGTTGGAFPATPFRSGDARKLIAALFEAGCNGVCGDPASLLARARADAGSAHRG